MSVEGIKKISREIFGDSRGVISWGHVASSVALVAALGWITKIVVQTHTLPPLDGITGFVTAPYVTNKIATAAQSFSQNPIPVSMPQQPPQNH